MRMVLSQRLWGPRLGHDLVVDQGRYGYVKRSRGPFQGLMECENR